MPKKPRFTTKQHRETGKQLQLMQNNLSTLSVEISKAYPVSSKALLMAERAEDAIRNVRNLLDNLACQENPGQDRKYYLLGGDYGRPKKRPRKE